MKKFFLNHKDNFNANSGEAFHSFSILYYASSPKKKLSTEITFLNLWNIQNNLNASVATSIISMHEKLIKRERLYFDRGDVPNHNPFHKEDFEGSTEVEIFSIASMSYPYPAFIVNYPRKSYPSITNSCDRVYSQHEVKNGKIFPFAHESSWATKDSEKFQGIGILHNGNNSCAEREVLSSLKIERGRQEYKQKIKFKELKPYGTRKIFPNEVSEVLSTKQNGGVGNFSLSSELGNAFERLLIGRKAKKDGSLQVTHSIINYQEIDTDFVIKGGAFFIIHNLNVQEYYVIIYPDFTEGIYYLEASGDKHVLESGTIIRIKIYEGERIKLSNSNERGIPSRLAQALEFENKEEHLRECSLNIFHKNKPHKRFHRGSEDMECSLVFTSLDDFFGKIKEAYEIIRRFYSSSKFGSIEGKLSGKDSSKLALSAFSISSATEIIDFIREETGWWSIYSNYSGLSPYVLCKDEFTKSITLEHAS